MCMTTLISSPCYQSITKISRITVKKVKIVEEKCKIDKKKTLDMQQGKKDVDIK